MLKKLIFIIGIQLNLENQLRSSKLKLTKGFKNLNRKKSIIKILNQFELSDIILGKKSKNIPPHFFFIVHLIIPKS